MVVDSSDFEYVRVYMPFPNIIAFFSGSALWH